MSHTETSSAKLIEPLDMDGLRQLLDGVTPKPPLATFPGIPVFESADVPDGALAIVAGKRVVARLRLRLEGEKEQCLL